ncbi:hypothetical protein HNR46_003275 [Haloferula luteola]|uniref:Bacterial repeat domain-containing protein n=1 Tax=Haloferula luteola TaxID=595692 RepID=A0A840V4X2_9BACT|nr:hypothetical protein [Haloferula luteola]MBB5353022.1 hypothetical protein [Haloferula luteola]
MSWLGHGGDGAMETACCMAGILLALGMPTAKGESWRTLGDVAVDGARDMAYDPTAQTLYVSTDEGKLQTFQLPSMEPAGAIQIGTHLRGLDLSPDHSKLAVGNSDNGRISILHLPEGTVEHFPLEASYGSGTVNSCAFLNNEEVMVGARVLNLQSGDARSVSTSYYGVGIVAANADRQVIAFTEPGISSGTAGLLEADGSLRASVGTGWFTYDVAVSPDGNQLVVPTYSGAFVYDWTGERLSRSGSLGTYATWWPRGVAYDVRHPYLFISFASHYNGYPGLVAYDPVSLEAKGIVEQESLFPNPGNSSFAAGHLRVSEDGHYLFALTEAGVRIYDISSPQVTLAVTASPEAGGEVQGGGTFPLGERVAIEAVPRVGWIFEGWSGGSDATAAQIEPVATAELQFIAHFAHDLSDSDEDGLTAFHEWTISHTDPERADTDGDGAGDGLDQLPLDPQEWMDTDGDGVGDQADEDDDNDGVSDLLELEVGTDPLDAASVPSDHDGDGVPDSLDEDDDNDGFTDEVEIVVGTDPFDATSRPSDADSDGIPDELDPDDDNDGVLDGEDDFPFDPMESVDTDGDGIGDLADPDDDNDGYLDDEDPEPRVPETVNGTYFGLLEATESLTGGYGGTLEVQVSRKGRVSGRLRMAGETLRFRSRLEEQQGAEAGFTVEIARRKRDSLFLEVQLGARLDGALRAGVIEMDYPPTMISGWKARWAPLSEEIGQGSGIYPVILGATDEGISSVPQGDGYLLTRVSKFGTSRWSGRLGDGTLISGSGPLSAIGEFPVWAAKEGRYAIQGPLNLSGDASVEGTLDWRRWVATSPKDGLYPAGFETLIFARGAQHAGRAHLDWLRTWAGPGNVWLGFSGAKVEASFTSPSIGAELTPSGKVITASKGSGANPAAVEVKIDPKTGLFRGSFVLKDLDDRGRVKKRRTAFWGVVVDGEARGYFILPSLPAPWLPVLEEFSGAVSIVPTSSWEP